MIQFNLLPDVKLEYIKAKRTKHTVILAAMAVAGTTFAVFVLLFLTVNVFQKTHLNNLSQDIKRDTEKLQNIEDLDRVLTVQNQLNKLTELHDGKPLLSRLKNYITQITPQQVSYANIDLDMTASTIRFSGSADSLKTINQFVDTLKFTKYKLAGATEETNAFSEVVLTSFGKDDKGASYEINLKFDPLIFSGQAEVTMNVPNIVTTRSAVEKPDENLLQPLKNTLEEGGAQ
jgi:peptidyl-tRNA hydrolase